MYVLILTLFWGNAPAIEHIHGFPSNASCIAAADAWLKQMDMRAYAARAICVKAQ